MHVSTSTSCCALAERVVFGLPSRRAWRLQPQGSADDAQVGVITVCDPYWLICYPTAVSTDAIVGDRSSTDFGINVGGGVNFGAFYAEARYHYVWGPR